MIGAILALLRPDNRARGVETTQTHDRLDEPTSQTAQAHIVDRTEENWKRTLLED